MAQRGRGTLEVRESNNPFFQTTNKNIGMDLARNRPFDAPRFARPVPRDANDGFDFRFSCNFSPNPNPNPRLRLKLQSALAEVAAWQVLWM